MLNSDLALQAALNSPNSSSMIILIGIVFTISFNLPLFENCFKKESEIKFLKCFGAVPPDIHKPQKQSSCNAKSPINDE